MEGHFDVALICKNGHLINSSSIEYPHNNTKYCKECGAEAIDHCQYCNSKIQGYINNGFYNQFEIPKYCHDCGKPYPWTEEKIKALGETIDLMEELTALEKEEFKKDALDISNDSPRTSLAALKIKKMRTRIGKEIWGVAKEILFQIGTETALKSMNLK